MVPTIDMDDGALKGRVGQAGGTSLNSQQRF
jgi:hypothetical protein